MNIKFYINALTIGGTLVEDKYQYSSENLLSICEKYRLVPSETNFNIIIDKCFNNGSFIEENLLQQVDNIRLCDKRRKKNNQILINNVISTAEKVLNQWNLSFDKDYLICILSLYDLEIITYIDIIIKAKGNKHVITTLISSGWEICSFTYSSSKNVTANSIGHKQKASRGDIRLAILKYKIDNILYCY